MDVFVVHGKPFFIRPEDMTELGHSGTLEVFSDYASARARLVELICEAFADLKDHLYGGLFDELNEVTEDELLTEGRVKLPDMDEDIPCWDFTEKPGVNAGWNAYIENPAEFYDFLMPCLEIDRITVREG